MWPYVSYQVQICCGIHTCGTLYVLTSERASDKGYISAQLICTGKIGNYQFSVLGHTKCNDDVNETPGGTASRVKGRISPTPPVASSANIKYLVLNSIGYMSVVACSSACVRIFRRVWRSFGGVIVDGMVRAVSELLAVVLDIRYRVSISDWISTRSRETKILPGTNRYEFGI